ncbi:oxidoreductase [Rhodococcus sp. ABRD24]|uniref:PDR/VanB family oxidoreductase n=1 Tax=Rhodococcus sp. ABRD24 TaxID=2507582 RepID=UPI001038A612|nr:PDR/VanB family oxidoreductase [Rhodococcus sp. ABRD24]QBJ96927.1 oxidoreductase [Rhodococcus sp. ABRD24]
MAGMKHSAVPVDDSSVTHVSAESAIRRASAPAGTETLTMRIVSMEIVAERIISIELEPRCGLNFPAWAPGSHVEVFLGEGIVRQYSLSHSPLSSRCRLGVLEAVDGRGGSFIVHHELCVGDDLVVSTPRNNFPFQPDGRHIIFVAGGIGITPLLSMIDQAATDGLEWTLLYLTRNPESTAFADELAVYGSNVRHHYDSVDGILDLVAELDARGGATADIYACGPAGLLDSLEGYRADRPQCRLTIERFASAGSVESSPEDRAFTVELLDGTEVAVGSTETILDALQRSGVRVLSSCHSGICGTCETRVLDGIPDHRDHILGPDERDGAEIIFPCVSRCRGSRLKLDL